MREHQPWLITCGRRRGWQGRGAFATQHTCPGVGNGFACSCIVGSSSADVALSTRAGTHPCWNSLPGNLNSVGELLFGSLVHRHSWDPLVQACLVQLSPLTDGNIWKHFICVFLCCSLITIVLKWAETIVCGGGRNSPGSKPFFVSKSEGEEALLLPPPPSKCSSSCLLLSSHHLTHPPQDKRKICVSTPCASAKPGCSGGVWGRNFPPLLLNELFGNFDVT